MLHYIFHRLFLAVPTLIGISLISFMIMHLAPGDPVDLFLGGGAGVASSEGISSDRKSDVDKAREELRIQLGLDKPLYIQYLNWLSNIFLRFERLDDFESGAIKADILIAKLPPDGMSKLRALEVLDLKSAFVREVRRIDFSAVEDLTRTTFWKTGAFSLGNNYEYAGPGIELYCGTEWRFITLNFGRSFKDQQPVIKRIVERLPITLEINLISFFLAYFIGVPLGLLLAVKRNTVVDRIVTTGTFMLWSLPSFWVGMLLILFFCNKEFFYWFPASGIRSLQVDATWSFWEMLTDHIHHMVLPVIASTYSSFAGISRFMRTSVLDNLQQDYVRTAEAKGLRSSVVLLRHVVRNSLIPIVTLMANLLPGMIAGSVFIETIFTIPGLGLLSFQSVIVRDYPMAMALFFIGGGLSLLGILIADILLKITDPRIDFSKSQT